MALTYTYSDAYLQPLITEATEDAAQAFVADVGTLPAHWVSRLCVIRAYVITCLDKQKAADDLFATKLANYKREFDEALKAAKAAQAVIDAESGTAAGGGSFFSVGLERA